ncbi:MAG: aldo/keto reductase, partial [Planctomycetota bacterium]
MPLSATPSGTGGYHQRMGNSPSKTLGKTGLHVSPYGFGCYRVHIRNPAFQDALKMALLNGCNLIDTSSNYGGDGGSEQLVGHVLGELFSTRQLQREEVVIVTKVGYVQGTNMALAQKRLQEKQPFPEMVRYTADCWHCIHPEFLENQLERSLKQLQVQKIDVYLLHNPEYFLIASKKKSTSAQEKIEEAYYQRISLAFDWMEKQVAQGKIASYGISSNTFPRSEDDETFTSLEKVLALTH